MEQYAPQRHKGFFKFRCVLGVFVVNLLIDPIGSNNVDSRRKAVSSSELQAAFVPDAEFFKPIPSPKPGDWLAEHKEPGQSFEEFVNANLKRPDDIRNIIYLQPLEHFLPDHSPPLELLQEYMQAFFMMDQRCQFNCLFCNSPNLDHEVTKKLTDDRIVSMTVEAEGMKAFALTSGVVGSPHETVVRMAGIVRRVREALPDLPVGVEPYIGEPEDIDLLLDAGADEIVVAHPSCGQLGDTGQEDVSRIAV